MENNEKVIMLAKPVKKGLVRLLFSRFFLIALLLVVQIAILVIAYGYFTEKLPVLINLLRLFSFIMVIYLFNCSMDASAKLTWMLIISILPIPGTVFLLSATVAGSGRQLKGGRAPARDRTRRRKGPGCREYA